MPLNIRMQWNAGTACVSECVLKTLACRGLRVGPSKIGAACDKTENAESPKSAGGVLGRVPDCWGDLSGTASATLNRESGDSNPVIARSQLNIDSLRFGLAILSRFSAILLRFHSFSASRCGILAILGPRVWESCD